MLYMPMGRNAAKLPFSGVHMQVGVAEGLPRGCGVITVVMGQPCVGHVEPRLSLTEPPVREQGAEWTQDQGT